MVGRRGRYPGEDRVDEVEGLMRSRCVTHRYRECFDQTFIDLRFDGIMGRSGSRSVRWDSIVPCYCGEWNIRRKTLSEQ